MKHPLQSLQTWAGTLREKLQPVQQRELNRKIAIALRRSQAQRIASQRASDWKAYVSRKNRSALSSKKAHIRRKKAVMLKDSTD